MNAMPAQGDVIELMVWDNSKVEFVIMSPRLAADCLKYNSHNRNLRQATVDAYARDMTAGAWEWNGETVKFSVSHELLDGQHRLAAIVKSGVEIPMLVVSGLKPVAQESVDTGAKRTTGDTLSLRGKPHANNLAAIIRRVYMHEHGIKISSTGGGTVKITNPELFATLKAHPELESITARTVRVRNAIPLPSATIGLCWWFFWQINPDDADFFFGRLASDEDHHAGEPIYELRAFLARNAAQVSGRRPQDYLTAIVIKAWNAYRDGAGNIRSYRWTPGGSKPEPFPVPR